MARPTIMTPEVIAKLEEAYAWGCTDPEACLWANIALATLYKYQEKNPKFTERKKELQETPIMLSRKNIVNALLRGDRETAKWMLERKRKSEFSTKTETDVKVEHVIPLVDIKELQEG